jgi:hypothetical protein
MQSKTQHMMLVQRGPLVPHSGTLLPGRRLTGNSRLHVSPSRPPHITRPRTENREPRPEHDSNPRFHHSGAVHKILHPAERAGLAGSVFIVKNQRRRRGMRRRTPPHLARSTGARYARSPRQQWWNGSFGLLVLTNVTNAPLLRRVGCPLNFTRGMPFD